MFWWMVLDLVFLVGRAASSGVFWGVCHLIMILGSLSANGWGCVPVLLVVWHGASSTGACSLLDGAGSQWSDGDLWESSCQLILRWAGRSLVVSCPELGSPMLRLRPYIRPEHQDTVSYTARYVGSFLPFGKSEVFYQCSVGVL